MPSKDASFRTLWQNIGSREVANHPFRPTTPARLTKFSMPSLRRRNGVPARGVETTKPGVSSTGQSLLKGNRDARNIHFLVRKFSTGELRLERRHCSQCCYVRRRRRLAGAFGPRLHHRRCLGDCFPQALMASQPTETGSPKGDPACARGIVSTSLAKYRKQGLLANAILKSTRFSGQAHEIFDDEPSASEGVPERGSKTTKPSATNTGLSH